MIIKNFFDKNNFKNNLRENKNSIILYILFTVYIIAISAIFLKLLILPNFTLIDIKNNNIEDKHKYIDSNLNNLEIYNLSNPIYDKINEYIILCRNGTLINKNININISSYNPKITVVIPVYNAAKTIKTAIRSIQNQQMTDIEILLVDDCSSDNSIEIIEQLQKEDSRIKLIKNTNTMGTLYTRSIGALNAKGKYIMPLDNDDLFINDIFIKCYEEAEKNNLDIIEFLGYSIANSSLVDKNAKIPYFLRFIVSGTIIRQPELSTYMFKKFGKIYIEVDAYLWGKCIKTEIYRKALDIIGKEIYTQNVVWTEDRIVNFGLFRIATSFKKINIYGIIYIDNNSSVGHNLMKMNEKKVMFDQLIYVANVFNLTKNSEDIRIAIYLLSKKWNKMFKQLSEENKFIATNLYNNIKNCSNISEFRYYFKVSQI